MNVQTVSTALATSLADLDIRVYDYGPDAPTGPAVYIYPQDIPQYHATFDGTVNADFVVRFLISSVASKSGQAQLNALISPTGDGSAVAAIEADKTFGGIVNDSRVAGMRNYGVTQLPDAATRYYSAELIIEVFAGP